jgi:hypothetical protein
MYDIRLLRRIPLHIQRICQRLCIVHQSPTTVEYPLLAWRWIVGQLLLDSFPYCINVGGRLERTEIELVRIAGNMTWRYLASKSNFRRTGSCHLSCAQVAG